MTDFTVEIDDEIIDITVDTPTIDVGVVESAAAIVTVEGPPGSGGSSLPDLAPTGDLWGLPGALINIGDEDNNVSPGVVYYHPITVSAPISVTAARCNVFSPAISAANMRFGIYAVDSAGDPSGAPLWDSGNVAVANDFTGVKTIDGLSVALDAGHYVLATSTSAALKVIGYVESGTRFISVDGLTGYRAAVMSFGAFPSPAPGPVVVTDPNRLQHFVLLQWTN